MLVLQKEKKNRHINHLSIRREGDRSLRISKKRDQKEKEKSKPSNIASSKRGDIN